jgi:hypothetical protein
MAKRIPKKADEAAAIAQVLFWERVTGIGLGRPVLE